MNKKIYSILFFVPLLVSFLTMCMVTGCSDDDEQLQSGYGYVQFKLLKSASFGNASTTRATTPTDKLEMLGEAQKVKVVMQYNGSTITQTLPLNSYNAGNAEFGLRSNKLELLAGNYTIIGFYLYDKLDQVLYAGPGGESCMFTVVAGGLHAQPLVVDAVARGMVTFKLVKDFGKTRSEEDNAYPFGNIELIKVVVKNLFTQELVTINNLRVNHEQDFTDKPADGYTDRNQETSYAKCDTVVWLKAGTYEVSSYTTYSDKDGKYTLETASVKAVKPFVVKDNEKTEDAEVPVRLSETAEYIKDYQALKAIWEKMGGSNWKYYGETAPIGSNWNFNKDIDLWGQQPGVQLLENGRVALLSLVGFGIEGDLPDEIGQLTELRTLSLGTHDEKLGGHLLDNYSVNMTEEQRKAIRMDYDTKFLAKDPREGLSDILKKGINDNPKMKPIKSSRVSLKDIQAGVMTNKLTGISRAIMRLTKLEQLFVGNCPIKSDHFFVDVKPDSPYYEEKDDWKWADMAALTDIEIYNCPKLTSLPTEMLSELTEVISLNIACNQGIPGYQLKLDWEAVTEGKSADKIQLLYMGFNNLEEFPDNDHLKKMVKLGLLDCTNNKIHKLQPFGKEIQLVKFYLDYNQITDIPYIYDNATETNFFFGWNDLETFSCTHNQLTKVPDIFNAKSKYVMGAVDFSNNMISGFENDDEHKGINAGSINLSNNCLEEFPAILAKKESPMQMLMLSGNGMKTIPKGALSGKMVREALTSLDLTHNKLSELTDDFYVINMPVLYGIDLSYNCFSKFPTQPLSINYLGVFGITNQRDADGNRILREWPTGLYKNPSLKAFYISSNDLRKIEDTISPFISTFDIKDNPNISINLSTVCPYIQAGQYRLIYDKTQDIRGCDALDLDK